MTLNIKSKDSLSFDEVIENPQGNAMLRTESILINFSLNTDYLLMLEKNGDEKFGLVLELTVANAIVQPNCLQSTLFSCAPQCG